MWLVCVAGLLFCAPMRAAKVGIKYNRGVSEYPKWVLADFQRFHADRIDTVMLCFPWNQMEPSEGQLAADFITKQLAPVLDYCAANKMTVIISNHCEYWGEHGNWSIPGWVQKKTGFESATSCLTDTEIRRLHTDYLKRLVDATKNFPAVVGYNLLNEPAAPTKWFLGNAKAGFLARWDGITDICTQLRQHVTEVQARQFLIIGNHGSEKGLEALAWKNTGKHDLTQLWTKTLDKVAAQGTTALIESVKWYADRPKIRTESALGFAMITGKGGDTENFGKTQPSRSAKGAAAKPAEHGVAFYDYDSVYDYEGLANAAVPKLEAFYAWRVGSPDGSAKHLEFLDHRNGDRPTPYYWALRDLASGIDSFETIDRSALPNDVGTAAFDPVPAKPGVSKRWTGTGKLTAEKDDLPPGSGSTIAAKLILLPGQSIARSVIAAHWKDSGVTLADSVRLQARAEVACTPTLVVQTARSTKMSPISIQAGNWTEYRVPLRALVTKEDEIPLVQKVGFINQSKAPLTMLIDDLLIRP